MSSTLALTTSYFTASVFTSFDPQRKHRIAVKVINYLGDKEMKVFGIG